MTIHKKQPKPIASLLQKSNYQKNTSMITQLDAVLQAYLQRHQIKGCRIGNIKQGNLIIESPTSLWLQRLQFMQSDLLSELRLHQPSIMKVKIKVNPDLAKISSPQLKKNKLVKKRAEKMSQEIAESFLSLADNADPKLKKALISLAKFSKTDKD